MTPGHQNSNNSSNNSNSIKNNQYAMLNRQPHQNQTILNHQNHQLNTKNNNNNNNNNYYLSQNNSKNSNFFMPQAQQISSTTPQTLPQMSNSTYNPVRHVRPAPFFINQKTVQQQQNGFNLQNTSLKTHHHNAYQLDLQQHNHHTKAKTLTQNSIQTFNNNNNNNNNKFGTCNQLHLLHKNNKDNLTATFGKQQRETFTAAKFHKWASSGNLAGDLDDQIIPITSIDYEDQHTISKNLNLTIKKSPRKSRGNSRAYFR